MSDVLLYNNIVLYCILHAPFVRLAAFRWPNVFPVCTIICDFRAISMFRSGTSPKPDSAVFNALQQHLAYCQALAHAQDVSKPVLFHPFVSVISRIL